MPPKAKRQPAKQSPAKTPLWKKLTLSTLLLGVGLLFATYLKATLFVPRISDQAATEMFDSLDKETLANVDAIKSSQEAADVTIDFGQRNIDDKFVLSLARISYMGATAREKVLTNKLQGARIDLIKDILEMMEDLGDCGQDHQCKNIEAAIKDNMDAAAETRKNGEDLLAIQSRVRDFLTPLTGKPTAEEQADFMLFMVQAVKSPATLVKSREDKPAFGDIAKLQASTDALVIMHRDLYREYTTRMRVKQAIASLLSRDH
ncbi:hypothetical protein [Dyella sp. C11]|uniref:hypothetical protein n=1 Tax=Dyella sp. C11 TaxID=2126991 RepID=UPI000D65B628|nr:hypothetical protein [Dyella sp. C11]